MRAGPDHPDKRSRGTGGGPPHHPGGPDREGRGPRRLGAVPWLRRIHQRLARLDGIDRFAVALLVLGILVMAWGTRLEPPSGLHDAVGQHFRDWAPGLVIDGLLLLVVNAIFRRHERARVLNQVGSLSQEFALDAVRRARDEGWLTDGSLRGHRLSRARLKEADLTAADLSGADLSFADLGGASLAYARLQGVDLTGASLTEADLRWADLEGADLRWADLRGALLDGARLHGALTRFASVDARHGDQAELPGAIAGGFLDDDQIRHVQDSFHLLQLRGTEPVELFYHRLFQAAPEVRHLFRADPRTQARKFLQSLKVIVSALHAPQRHIAVLQRLGERHHGYGATPEHYTLVGDVLLSVMEDTLGDQFTLQARDAWERAYHLMASVMTGGETAVEERGPDSPVPNRDDIVLPAPAQIGHS